MDPLCWRPVSPHLSYTCVLVLLGRTPARCVPTNRRERRWIHQRGWVETGYSKWRYSATMFVFVFVRVKGYGAETCFVLLLLLFIYLFIYFFSGVREDPVGALCSVNLSCACLCPLRASLLSFIYVYIYSFLLQHVRAIPRCICHTVVWVMLQYVCVCFSYGEHWVGYSVGIVCSLHIPWLVQKVRCDLRSLFFFLSALCVCVYVCVFFPVPLATFGRKIYDFFVFLLCRLPIPGVLSVLSIRCAMLRLRNLLSESLK